MTSARNWHQHWSEVKNIASYSREDLLRQVGKTVFGQPIENEQISVIVQQIRDALKLTSEEVVIEIGCGNGLLTVEAAELCKHVYAIDYSEPLIETAGRLNGRVNVSYRVGAAEDRSSYSFMPEGVRKVYSYEMLQHLTIEQTRAFLSNLYDIVAPQAIVFIGSIPDMARIRNFYNTDERWHYYLANVKSNTEQIGHWWDRGELTEIAQSAGFSIVFREQSPFLYTSHYRFNVILEK
jgi:2-polyprenyl-3-methyl-5-hydroxy-6-metoxy-1,4-benzoquinol methylase